MKVDNALLERLAMLSRLEFTDVEKDTLRADLTDIFVFVEKLEELDTSNVEPLVYITDSQNVFREDEVHTDLTKSQALALAPIKDSDFIKVPKVMRK